MLLNIARHAPVATTQRFARVYGRARQESSGDLEEKLRRREIRRGFQDDGTYRLSAHLMGDEGVLLDRVLDETLEGLKAERAEGVDDDSAGYHQVMVADLWAWIEGGLTDIEDLRLYCRGHHVLLHEGGFKVVLGADGSLTHLRPDGSLVYEPRSRLPRSVSVDKVACERGLDGTTRAPLFPDKLDHRYAAGVVADRDELWGRRATTEHLDDDAATMSDPPSLPPTSRGP